jgi:hypothetical protein
MLIRDESVIIPDGKNEYGMTLKKLGDQPSVTTEKTDE